MHACQGKLPIHATVLEILLVENSSGHWLTPTTFSLDVSEMRAWFLLQSGLAQTYAFSGRRKLSPSIIVRFIVSIFHYVAADLDGI